MQRKEKYYLNNDRYRWVYVILGNIIMMCIGTIYSWSVFRTPIEKLFNIGATQSGLPYMTSLAFYALFMMISGRYINIFSPFKAMTTGAILIALGWIFSSFAKNIYILTLTYGAISGAGVGIAYGVPLNVVSKWFPDKKGLAVGLVLVGFGLSPILTAPIANMLIVRYGVMDAFMILGAVFLLLIPLLSKFFKYPDVNYKKETSNNFKQRTKKNGEISASELIRTRSFKILYLNFMIGTMIGLMLIGMTGKIGSEMFNLPHERVTIFMSLFAVFNGIGRPIFGWLTDKLSYHRTAIFSYVIIAFAALLMIVANERSTILFVISFSLFWFNLGGWLAIAPAATATLYGPRSYSENYGIVFTAYGIGAVLGVMGSGILVDFTGNYKVVFLMVIALCMIGYLIIKLLWSRI